MTLKVSSSPHIKHEDRTRYIMLDVIIALLSLCLWGTFIFGYRVIAHCALSVFSCVFFEFAYGKFAKKPCSVGDLSAVVTGLLIALCLPVSAPLYLDIIGSAFAIIVIKQLFGGRGKNILNPALCAWLFLRICFPAKMTCFTASQDRFNSFGTVDAVSCATPLQSLKAGEVPSISLWNMFLGIKPGSIGEVAVLLIIVCFVFLLLRRVIKWHIPVSIVATVALISYLFPPQSIDAVNFVTYQLLSGGLIFGAVFMATDYSTSPVTNTGKIIFGIGCGIITVIIRYFTPLPEGICIAILIMNLFARYIDEFTRPIFFGGERKSLKSAKTEKEPKNAQDNEKAKEVPAVSGKNEKGRFRAQVMCSGTYELTKKKYVYEGISDCVSAAKLAGGSKLCPNGCIGLGTCKNVCKYDAIKIINGVAAVDYEKCTACGECEKACPKNIIRLVPYDAVHWVGCMSQDKGSVASQYCDIGCTGCKKCEKVCPSGAIKVVHSVAEIDYSLCTGCGECEKICPRKVIWSGISQSKQGFVRSKKD